MREALTDKAIGLLRQARQATGPVWQRLAARNPSPELAESVEELKGLLGSEQFTGLARRHRSPAPEGRTTPTRPVTSNSSIGAQRPIESAIEEIKNRPEWGPLADGQQGAWPRRCCRRCGRGSASKKTRTQVEAGTSLGKVQPHRDGVGPGGGRGAEVVGAGQAARIVARRREEGPGSTGPGLGVFNRPIRDARRTRSKPSSNYGTRFRSTSTKAQSIILE